MRGLRPNERLSNATTTIACTGIPDAIPRGSPKPKNRFFLPVRTAVHQLKLSQTQLRITRLATTQIVMVSACSPRLIRTRFPPAQPRSVAMDRTVLVVIIEELARITVELRGGWTNELHSQTISIEGTTKSLFRIPMRTRTCLHSHVLRGL